MEAPILSETDTDISIQEMNGGETPHENETETEPETDTITLTENVTNTLVLNDNETEKTSVDTSVVTNDVIMKDAPAVEAEVEPEPEPEPEPEDSSMEENPDRTTESPTTGDNNNTLNGIKCVYCNQVLNATDEPKLLECLHSACGACVKSKIAEQSQTEVENSTTSKALPVITCGACRIVCRQSQIIDNQFLIELTNDESAANENSKNEDQKCKSCDENETATSWCVECAEFICAQCVQAHKRLKITKDHTIKSREEALQEQQNSSSNTNNKNLICPIHHNEQLTLFCENCDILTCRDCQLTDHRDHKYKFTHEIASETKKFIQGMLKDVSYKRVLLSSAMKVIDDRQNLISEKKQTLVKEITQMVVKLTNTINIRGKELVHRLNEVCDNKQKTLNEKKVALDNLSQLTDHCIEFVQSALDKGSDMAILYTKRHVTNHLQRIKCRRADIPNPEIPVRIHLALDKVPDLIKVLSSIGAIVVDGKVYPPSSTMTTSISNTPSTSPVPVPVPVPVQRTAPAASSPLLLNRMPPPYPQQQQSQQQQQQQQQQHEQHQQHQQHMRQQLHRYGAQVEANAYAANSSAENAWGDMQSSDPLLSDILDQVIDIVPDAVISDNTAIMNLLDAIESPQNNNINFQQALNEKQAISAIRKSLMQCETAVKSPSSPTISMAGTPPAYSTAMTSQANQQQQQQQQQGSSGGFPPPPVYQRSPNAQFPLQQQQQQQQQQQHQVPQPQAAAQYPVQQQQHQQLWEPLQPLPPLIPITGQTYVNPNTTNVASKRDPMPMLTAAYSSSTGSTDSGHWTDSDKSPEKTEEKHILSGKYRQYLRAHRLHPYVTSSIPLASTFPQIQQVCYNV